MSDQVLLALMALFGTITGGLFKLINDQTKVHAKLAHSMDKVAASNEKIATETKLTRQEIKVGNQQSEARNGHLAEISVQQGDRIMQGIEHIKEQHVDKQVVNKQVKE